MTPGFYHSVRFKLLLVSLTLLGIPWAGYQFIVETEQFLRDAQNRNLQSTAQVLARLVEQHRDQFPGSHLPGQEPSRRNLYMHQWDRAPVMDGYADEWGQFDHAFSDYRLPDGSLASRLALGRHAGYAYLLLAVTDHSRQYGRNGDQVELSIGRGEQLMRLRIRPDTPGWVMAEELRGHYWTKRLTVRGEWQESGDGYTLELRMPASLLGERMSIGILDSGEDNRLLSARLFPLHKLGRLVRPSSVLQALLKETNTPATRSWVVDHEGLVLASAGRLDTHEPLSADQEDLPWLLRQAILAVLPRRADASFDIEPSATRLDRQPVAIALAGRPAHLRRHAPGSDVIVVGAAVPLLGNEGVLGAVLIEQTTNAILSIQNLALQRLFMVTLVLFAVTSLGLLLFASLLTARIRRLRNQLDQAVSHDGRIVGEIHPDRSLDEIGELGRGFAAVLQRLHDYNHYLEAMASRLAHELRTPLSVLRTSLDNARQSADQGDHLRYLERADQGAHRLDLILQRLREATRLEQSLQQAEFEHFDLAELLHRQVEGFCQVWPGQVFTLSTPDTPCPVRAVPDMLCQALEKLVGNAVDFSTGGTPVTVVLKPAEAYWRLAVYNQGPPLPDDIDLFKSMVSGRTGRSEEPHLGLGLYLVRLICEFHAGRCFAQNLPVQGEVSLGMELPADHR